MINLRKISPVVRAVGTVGAVAGLVGAVTFANLTSNTVALTPNDITTAGASLVIHAGAGGDCATTTDVSTPGISAPALAPGASVTPVNFCIKNTGDVPLNLSAAIPQAVALAGSVAAQNITFGISCGALGSPTTTLSIWSPEAFGGGALAAGATVDCTATASLALAYGGPGDEPVPSFAVVFTGTQP